MKQKRRTWALAAAASLGLALFGHGLYIPAKAVLAQYLLEDAWQQTLRGAHQARPWGWADTWPVARLRQPRLGIDQIVLAGASGRVLAFGPGRVSGSAVPGEPGNVVISGHRDTHFAWLAQLRDGDRLDLQLPDGRDLHYVVLRHWVANRRQGYLLDPDAYDGLRLITCYPFDALLPDGSQRYVVDAVAL
jgi:sortase A